MGSYSILVIIIQVDMQKYLKVFFLIISDVSKPLMNLLNSIFTKFQETQSEFYLCVGRHEGTFDSFLILVVFLDGRERFHGVTASAKKSMFLKGLRQNLFDVVGKLGQEEICQSEITQSKLFFPIEICYVFQPLLHLFLNLLNLAFPLFVHD